MEKKKTKAWVRSSNGNSLIHFICAPYIKVSKLQTDNSVKQSYLILKNGLPYNQQAEAKKQSINFWVKKNNLLH